MMTPVKLFARNSTGYNNKIYDNFNFTDWGNDDFNIMWIGHSTLLINYFGTIVLTDPAFFERIGLYLFGESFGPARMTPPAVGVDDIPKPDIVLLSHAHMDHTDYPTLKHIAKKYPGEISLVVAYLTRDVTDALPWKDVTVLDWGEEADVLGIKIKAFEVKHFGWRYPWERDRSRGFFKDGRSYNAYLMEKNNFKVLFGGDTAYTPKLGEQITGGVDVALMPIGAYDPWIRVHCDPEEAVKMAEEINSRVIIPMHTMTFNQSNEPFDEPVIRLKAAVKDSNLELGLDKIGGVWSYHPEEKAVSLK